MAGEVAGENFYKFLFLTRRSPHETFSHVKPVRSFGTIKSKPVMGTVGTKLIQPDFVLRHTRLDLLKTQTLAKGYYREQQRECQDSGCYFLSVPHCCSPSVPQSSLPLFRRGGSWHGLLRSRSKRSVWILQIPDPRPGRFPHPSSLRNPEPTSNADPITSDYRPRSRCCPCDQTEPLGYSCSRS